MFVFVVRRAGVTSIFSDDDEALDDDDMMESIGCFGGMLAPAARLGPASRLCDTDRSASLIDVSKASPGAYAATPHQLTPASAHAERMSMDLASLKKQYSKVRQRQKQAHIILTGKQAHIILTGKLVCLVSTSWRLYSTQGYGIVFNSLCSLIFCYSYA